MVRPGRAAARRRRSRHPARLEGDDRRSRGFLRAQGWDIDLAAHVRRGGRVLGLCGGYQMLGARLADPDGIEGPPGERRGARPARRRDGADRRQDADRGRGRLPSPTARPSAATRCMSGEPAGPTARGRCCASPTAGRRRGLGRRARDAAPTSMACSPTIASAPAGWPGSARRLGLSPTSAEIERTLDALAAILPAHVDLDRLLSLAR